MSEEQFIRLSQSFIKAGGLHSQSPLQRSPKLRNEHACRTDVGMFDNIRKANPVYRLTIRTV
ncbi:hypothetical protein MAR_002693 [Mya arenaria]|uniref:Uncharacterized protein n=1 Tax=Mya arenaria TaxID=6604 RepID=A0ABY7G3W4_MYAAR|nr:hypothetical protein MAR_002693 [Mya arenaria]